MEVRSATLTSIQAKRLEKKGFENKGYIDMQAGKMAFYAELHNAEWVCADNPVWLDLVISLPQWAWRKWFFTDEQGHPTFICFKCRWSQ